jgi:hypothetical protein
VKGDREEEPLCKAKGFFERARGTGEEDREKGQGMGQGKKGKKKGIANLLFLNYNFLEIIKQLKKIILLIPLPKLKK